MPDRGKPYAIVLHRAGFLASYVLNRVRQSSPMSVRLVGIASALRWSTQSASDATEGVSSRAAEGTTQGSSTWRTTRSTMPRRRGRWAIRQRRDAQQGGGGVPLLPPSLQSPRVAADARRSCETVAWQHREVNCGRHPASLLAPIRRTVSPQSPSKDLGERAISWTADEPAPRAPHARNRRQLVDTCQVCGRTLLTGEGTREIISGERALEACSLCVISTAKDDTPRHVA